MALNGVPWAIDGGAEHGADIGRLLAYMASGGSEGVIGLGSLQVRKLDVAGAGVQVMPGAATILNRGAGGGLQNYVVRNDAAVQVPVTPTGSSGGRVDMLAVVVEDPKFAGQPAPASVVDGPYVRFKVYTNVPGTATLLSEVDPTQTGYAVARWTLGASDGTIEQADIVDLRQIAQPRSRTYTRALNLPGTAPIETLGAATVFPSQAVFPNIYVPEWATRANLECIVDGVEFTDTTGGGGFMQAEAKVRLGGIGDTGLSIYGSNTEVRRVIKADTAGSTTTFGWVCANELQVPAGMRGKVQEIHSEAVRKSGSNNILARTTWGTSVILRVTFTEDVDLTYWEA